MQHSNALMTTSSFDRISSVVATGNTLSVSTQPLNNFRVQTLGGNIVQGQINKIRVAEIMFPYDIPTIVQYQNDLLPITVISVNGATGAYTDASFNVVVTPGFYKATELASAISGQFAGLSPTLANLTCAVDPVSNAIYFRNTGVFAGGAGDTNYVYAFTPITGQRQLNGSANINFWSVPTLLWSLGFKNLYASTAAYAGLQTPNEAQLPLLVPSGYPTVAPYPRAPAGAMFQAIVGTPFVGAYTQYIDICSPALCQAQYVRDGNTNQTVIRRDLLARVYIASEVSTATADPVGTAPFIIHRQFKNAKIMKWTVERSVDSIDLALYDQYGQPLPAVTPIAQVGTVPAGFVPIAATGYSGSRDFAITFLVDEHDEGMSPNLGYTA
jgi:hypothetical protein